MRRQSASWVRRARILRWSLLLTVAASAAGTAAVHRIASGASAAPTSRTDGQSPEPTLLGLADRVLHFEPGIGASGDPDRVVRPDSGRVAAEGLNLGFGGALTLAFVDNLLVSSGDDRPDLLITGSLGVVDVALRAADDATHRDLVREFGDADADGFVTWGRVSGSSIEIDLDARVKSIHFAEHRFNAVRVTDRSTAPRSPAPGSASPSPATVVSVLALTVGVVPIDVIGREISVQIPTIQAPAAPFDSLSREISIEVADPMSSGSQGPFDALSREVSIQISSDDPSAPRQLDVLSREVSFEIPGLPSSGPLQLDAVSREYSVQVFDPNANDGALDVIGREVSFFVPGGPDLRVVSMNAPALGSTGETVSFSWLVRNAGNAETGATWVERVSFSSDGTTAGIVSSFDVPVTGALAPGTNRALAAQLNAPSLPGSYWLIVDTDATGLVVEDFRPDSEENNRLVASAATVVVQTPRPALGVIALTPPRPANPGDTVEVVWWTRNTGTAAAAGTWTESITLAENASGVGSRLLAVVTASGPLAPGASEQRIASVTLPASLPSDPWLIVCTNAGSELVLLPGTVTCSAVAICTRCEHPDVVAIDVDAPATSEAGQPMLVSWTVRNAGNGEAVAPWTDTLELRRESDGSVVAAAFFTHASSLTAGAERIATAVLAIPGDADGPHRARVLLDVQNQLFEPGGETNNLAIAARPTSIGQPPRPDLAPTSLALSDPTPTTNEVIAVTWNVANVGNDPAVGPWQDGIYLSTQPTFSLTTAELRATYANTLAIAPGATYPASIVRSVAMPSTPGTYYLYALADRFDDIEEGLAEGNNAALIGGVVVSYPPRPNLAVASLVPAPAGPAGTLVNVAWTVTNNGQVDINTGSSGPTNAQWNERIYASSDPSIGGDLLLASHVYGDALPIGGLVDRIRAVPVPPLPAGYYLVVQVDPTNAVSETNENDNFGIARDPSYVALPNLVTTDVAHPPAAFADARVTVGWTVTNVSTEASANGPWLDTVYIRPAGTSGLQPLGSSVRSAPVAPGASYTSSLAVTIPGNSSGANEIFVVSDTENAVAEDVSADNTAFGPAIAITQPPRPNLVVESISLPSSDLVQRPFTAAWRLRNIGTTAVTVPFTDRVYAVDAASGTEHVVGFATVASAIEPGDALDLTAPATMPPVSGAYRLVVVTDRTNAINEGISGGENDNRTTTAGTFTAENFVVVASTPISAAPTPPVVPIDGVATTSVSGEPASNVHIDVAVDLRGTRRIVRATTGVDGTFNTEFRPLPGEAGAYELRAGPRDHVAPAVTDDFVLYAMRAEPSSRSLIVYPGFRPTTTAFVLRNAGDAPLSGVLADVSSLPAGVSVQPTLTSTDVPSLGTTLVDVQIEAASGTATQALSVALVFSTNQGATAIAQLELTIRPPAATIVPAQQPLTAAMELPGPDGVTKQTLVQLELRNMGSGTTQPVNVLPPAITWLNLATAMPLDPLLPGETTTVTFILRPTASDVPAGATATGQVAVTGGATTTFVPFQFRAFLPGESSIEVHTTDEGSYWGLDGRPLTNGPRVADATVTVREHFTQALLGSATTTATGMARFENLAPGYYDIRSSAPGHATSTITRYLAAGESYVREAFMPIVGVSYTWSVVPTEIEDQYVISVNTTFQTFVPAPVITIAPVYADLDALAAQAGGQPFQIDYTITNHGLIRADDVRFAPTPASGYSLSAMATDLGHLAAGQSIVVPVIVTPISALGSGGCGAQNRLQLDWTIVCGVPVPYFTYAVVHSSASCPPPPPPPPFGCGDPGGSSGPGGGSGSGGGDGGDGGSIDVPPPPSSSGLSCECIEEVTSTVIGCVAENPCASFIFDCARPAIQYVSGSTPDVSLGDVVDCAMNGAECLGLALPGPLVVGEVLGCACSSVKALLTCYGSSDGGGGGGPGSCVTLDDIPCSPGGLVDLATTLIYNPDCHSGLSNERLGRPDWRGFLGSSEEPTKQYWLTNTERLTAIAATQWYPFGSAVWIDVSSAEVPTLVSWQQEFELRVQSTSDEGVGVSAGERAELLALARPSTIADSDVHRFLDRWNRTAQYWDSGVYTAAQVPAGFETDFIDLEVLAALWNASWDSIEAAQSEGFAGVMEAWQFADHVLALDLYGPQAGVCATVEVQIDQTVALTRSAFRASLGLDNSSDMPLDVVDVDLRIRTTAGEDAEHLFAIQVESLTGIAALDGTASLPPASNASVSWLLVPSSAAAPTEPLDYSVSGSISFVRNGVFTLLPLAPIGIEVLPNADLNFSYFVERDVFSDDPFTNDVLEPAVPFDLGLRVENEGAGSASNLTITSAQPEIVRNDDGLLIDFQIIGSQVGTLPSSPSLAVSMGDFGPGRTNAARWRMTSTLQGKFIGFEATVQNLNGLDDPEFWIIDPQVDVRPMLRSVHADDGDDDGVFDFLGIDPLNLVEAVPNRVWMSDGTDEPVDRQLALTATPIPGSTLRAQLSATVDPDHWTYLRLADPFNGQYALTGVERSDGKALQLGPNAWQTARYLTNGPSVRAPRIHLFDRGGVGSYTLFFDADVVPPRIATWASYSAYGSQGYYSLRIASLTSGVDPRVGGPLALRATFDERVDSTTFNPANVLVTMNVGNQLIGRRVEVATHLVNDGTVGEIVLLSPAPDRSRLCVQLSGVKDQAGNLLTPHPARLGLSVLVGDVTNDGAVTGDDLALVELLAGSSPIDPNSIDELRCDIDRSGAVDAADRAIVQAQLGLDLSGVPTACAMPTPQGH